MSIQGLDGLLEALKALPPELVSKNGGPVGRGLRAGAKLVAGQARTNVRTIVAKPNKDGRNSRSTQALEKAIVTKRDPRPQRSGANERFVVTVRGNQVNPVTGRRIGEYGGVLEFGSAKLPAERWLRGAIESKKDEALQTIVTTMRKGLDAAVRKAKRKGLRR